ncbi:MAG TPA: PLP-dependent aminotransferase family protein, partial [Thermoanaerobaculia bacterium]
DAYAGDAAGMHLTVLLRGRRDDRAIAAEALRRSLYVSALSDAYAGDAPRPGFILGFGNTRESQIAGAVRQLRELLDVP